MVTQRNPNSLFQQTHIQKKKKYKPNKPTNQPNKQTNQQTNKQFQTSSKKIGGGYRFRPWWRLKSIYNTFSLQRTFCKGADVVCVLRNSYMFFHCSSYFIFSMVARCFAEQANKYPTLGGFSRYCPYHAAALPAD